MGILFSSRVIVDAFKTRNVVFESSASVAGNGDLILRSSLEFGDNGVIKRQAIIKTDSLHTFSINTQIGKYHADILEIIDALESTREWMRGKQGDTFSQFLDQDTPLFFYAKATKGKVVFSVFGPTLRNLELYCEQTRKLETTPFVERITVMADLYRSHLKELDGIALNEVIQHHLKVERVA